MSQLPKGFAQYIKSLGYTQEQIDAALEEVALLRGLNPENLFGSGLDDRRCGCARLAESFNLKIYPIAEGKSDYPDNDAVSVHAVYPLLHELKVLREGNKDAQPEPAVDPNVRVTAIADGLLQEFSDLLEDMEDEDIAFLRDAIARTEPFELGAESKGGLRLKLVLSAPEGR